MSYTSKHNHLLIVFLSYFICFASLSKADSKGLLEIPLDEIQSLSLYKAGAQIGTLEDEISALTDDIADFAWEHRSESEKKRLLIYLENNTDNDFIITDIIANLDNVTSHFNFSDQKEILMKESAQKFYLDSISAGHHQLRLTFLIYHVAGQQGSHRSALSNPISPCLHLTDAHCLHRKAENDPRIKNQCTLEFKDDKENLHAHVSFKNDGTCITTMIPTHNKELPFLEYKSARAHFQNQNYFLALSILNNLDECGNLADEILFLRAEAYLKMELYRHAVSCYTSIIENNELRGNEYYALSIIRLGIIHLLSKEYEQAVSTLHKLPPSSRPELRDECRFLTAISYYNLNKFEKLSSHDNAILYLRALGALKQKKFSEATQYFTHILENSHPLYIPPLTREILSPERIMEDCTFYLAKVLYRQNKYSEAEKKFSAIPRTSTHYKDALIGKGMILLRQNKTDELSSILKELVEQYNEIYFTSDARFALAQNHKMTGDFDQAFSHYEKALSVCQAAIEYLDDSILYLENYNNPLLPIKGLSDELATDSNMSAFTSELKRLQRLEDTIVSLQYGTFGAKPHTMMRSGMISYLLGNNSFSAYSERIAMQQEEIKKYKDLISAQLIAHIKEKASEIKTSYMEIINRGKLEIELAQSTMDLNAKDPVLDQIITSYSTYLSEFPESPYADKITFQLAEIYYQKALIDFQKSLRDTDSKSDPKPHFDSAIALYGKMLWKFPESIYLDKALYALGYAYYEQGTLILAKNAFRHLLNRYPESSLAPEVMLRLAEIFFDENDFEDATILYQKALKRGEFPEHYSNDLLYKLAWSYYKEDKYEDSFSVFISLIDRYKENSSNPQLANDIMNQLSRILTDFIDISLIQDYLAMISEKTYHVDILYAVADSLFNEGRFKDAIIISQEAIKKYPLYARTPLLYSMIEQCYLKQNDPYQANHAREDLIRNYGENSPWWVEHTDAQQREIAFSLIDEAIRRTTFYLLQKKDENNYRHLISLYRDNKYSPTNEAQINALNFYLAECLFKTQQYNQALEEYKKLLTKKENNAYYEEAAYKMIVTLEKILSTGYQWKYRDKKGPLNEKEQEFLAACDRVTENFPEYKYRPEILYKKAELLYNRERYKDAIPPLHYIIEHYPQSEVYKSALKIAAHAYFQNENYHAAAEQFSLLVKLCDSLLKEKGHTVELFLTRKESHKMHMLSRFKGAEQSGNAEEFRSVAKEFPNAEIADVALYEAASLYKEAENDKMAYEIFQYLIKHYPKSPHTPAALLQVAAFYEKENDHKMAATSYEHIYRTYPKFEGSINALYKAGMLYERLQDWKKEEEIFELYLSKNPKEKLIEALFRKGYAQKKQNKNNEAFSSFQIAADTYKTFNEDTSTMNAYFAAWAQFSLAEEYFTQYTALHINGLSDEEMKRKLQLLSALIESYKKVYDYKVARWTTNATYTIACAIENLCDELLSPKKPAPLKSENEYLRAIQLKQKIANYYENAISFYKKNIDLWLSQSIENEWIDKSREKLVMNIARWGNVYEQIAQLIRNAPLPSILSEDEREQYRKALGVKAQSFINLAIKAYEENTNAYTWKISQNKYVKESYQRLAELSPQRYRREVIEIRRSPASIHNVSDHLYMEK
ncbi:MAG: tetratricopeptide repeat protein [bacterium]